MINQTMACGDKAKTKKDKSDVGAVNALCQTLYSSCRLGMAASSQVPQKVLDDIQNAMEQCLRTHPIFDEIKTLKITPKEIPIDEVKKKLQKYIHRSTSTEVHPQKYIHRSTSTEVHPQKYIHRSTSTEVHPQKYIHRSTSTEVHPQKYIHRSTSTEVHPQKYIHRSTSTEVHPQKYIHRSTSTEVHPQKYIHRSTSNFRNSADYADCDVRGEVRDNAFKICLTINFFTTQNVKCNELVVDTVLGLAVDNSAINVNFAKENSGDFHNVMITRL
ncbi:hypothetical protein BgiMline_020580 [Biomphalaria glabrata]|nr:hypothetical protein BgiMline_017776 [Biomphalaria glabrata]